MSSTALAATMLLCDWAEAIQGKLYIMGGGWTQLTLNTPASDMTLAITISVPWSKTNVKLPLVLELVTEDGEPVLKDDKPIRVEGLIEAGRPPGSKPGTSFVSPLAVRVGGIELEPGEHAWSLMVDKEELARTSFTVVRGLVDTQAGDEE